MKKNFYTLVLLGLFATGFSQTGNVGINTTTPTATLDVNGNAKIRNLPNSSTLAGNQVLGIDTTTKEVKALDTSLFSSNVNTSVYAAKRSNAGSLINIGLLTSNFRGVNFTAAERTIGDPLLFTEGTSSTGSYYTVPSTGIYNINYNFRYDEGVKLTLLGGTPGVGIVRQPFISAGNYGTPTVLDTRTFSGISVLGLLSITISESSINSIYQLNQGDRLYFGLTAASLLDLGALGSSTASFSIYKISN